VKSRDEAIKAIESKAFDVCVIGGGASGAGCALDSQLRGLRTVLLEGEDFASATSSASTKIVHGGVRYLQEAVEGLDIRQYRVVKRALRERSLMLKNAPFLTWTLEFLVPCLKWSEVLYYGFGLKVYDRMAGKAGLSPSRYISRGESLKRLPGLKPDRLLGTVAYADGGFDDARYALTLLQTFTDTGGEVLNYARVVGFEKDRNGKLAAAAVENHIEHNRFAVRARAFVNATGPFSDNVRQLAAPGTPKRMRPSKGIHIVLPLDGFSQSEALLIPKTEDGRVIFAVPWLGRLLVGTTDEEATLQDELLVRRSEAEYVLRHLNSFLAKPFTLDQIVSGTAGLRPLVSSGDSCETKKLVRDDEVEIDAQSGLISILGGKWTTHRAMAEDTIDAVLKYLRSPVTECRTRYYRLSGSEGYETDYWCELTNRYDIPATTAHHLAGKFGTSTPRVLELVSENSRLRAPVVEGAPPIQAEVVYGVRYEMARTIEDVLARRIGLQLYSWRDAIKAAPVVGSLLAEELGWPALQLQSAVEEYVATINRYLTTAGLKPESAPDLTPSKGSR
jgi:glycerol-3-phosphate dehydrogenase